MRIRWNLIEKMWEEAQATYPFECCGILVGKLTQGEKVVELTLPTPNAWNRKSPLLPLPWPRVGKGVRAWQADETPLPDSGKQENRFLIPPEAFLRAEKKAREEGYELLGFYHSHPDHPPRPSSYDLEYAWPTYSYLILSVEEKKPAGMNSWVLQDDRNGFHKETIELI